MERTRTQSEHRRKRSDPHASTTGTPSRTANAEEIDSSVRRLDRIPDPNEEASDEDEWSRRAHRRTQNATANAKTNNAPS
mmetsp:Transcript_20223/g.47515  ORF Transcript_20223/g.47515 Transcript_20223/m.47515 type:complete len:80 (-) Transcript_20223:70-309(-)